MRARFKILNLVFGVRAPISPRLLASNSSLTFSMFTTLGKRGPLIRSQRVKAYFQCHPSADGGVGGGLIGAYQN